MITDEAVVKTANAARHLAQLVRHAAHMSHSSHRMSSPGGHVPPAMRGVDATHTKAILELRKGRCIVEATPAALMLRVEAADDETLAHLRELIAKRVETIGSRDGLKVTWQSDTTK